jgi:signal transduction histidine kinase/DNA-binding response OmpR family regulator
MAGPVRILLIEDNPEDAQIMQEAVAGIKDGGFALEWVDRLEKGLARLPKGGIDLVLTDLQLPDAKGLDTVTKVRAAAQNLPLVVLTSQADVKLSTQAMQLGAQDYLVKGYVQVYPDLLFRAIRYAMERHRAEQEMRRLAFFPEQTPDPIIETDGEGAVTYLNPAARRQFPDLEASGLRHPVLRGLPELIQGLARDGKTIGGREVAYDSRVFDHRVSVHPDSQRVRSYVVDITARKEMEERERELNAAVRAAAVAEGKRAAELEHANRELKQTQAMLIQAEKMAAVGQLASGIAHEVKNPLNILLQCVNYLEPELQKQGGQPAEILQAMREAVVTADRIIRGLLDFSKPAPLELKPAPIGRVIDASVLLVQNQIASKRIQLAKDIPGTLPLVLLDENQMKQVFINILMNALQAMGEGGRLTVRSYVKKLTAPGRGVGERTGDVFRIGDTALVCEVQDTGSGIPRELLSRVFNPFFTTKPPGEGVGLGLSITSAIVHAHHGVIDIESEVDRGTTVIIMLPVTPG